MGQNKYIKLIGWLVLMVLVIGATANAHNKVVVIPLGGDDAKPLQNVIRVSPQNGDFSSISAAIDSIDNAGAQNRYLVFVGPGTYTVTSPVSVPQYVSILGSGTKSTIISGSIGGNQAFFSSIFITRDDSSIAGMRIINNGGSSLAIGIYARGSTIISDVDILANGSQSVFGIFTESSSAGFSIVPTIKDSTILITSSTASSAGSCRGIYNRRSAAIMRGLRITVRCSNAANAYGIYQFQTFNRSELHDSQVLARQAEQNSVGVYNFDANILINNSNITGELIFGTEAYGFQNATPDSIARIQYSTKQTQEQAQELGQFGNQVKVEST